MLLHGSFTVCFFVCFFLFQAEDGIRDLVRSRGLGDVYKRQVLRAMFGLTLFSAAYVAEDVRGGLNAVGAGQYDACLFYTSDAADERPSADLGGRRLIKKKQKEQKKKRQRTGRESQQDQSTLK